jgi:Flp pilus assembly protein TadG
VEFALTAPLVFFLGLTAYEFCRVYSILHTMENAAYEGCRRGIVHGASSDSVRAAAEAVLSTVYAQGATVTCEPDPITADAAEVTVTINVPMDQNAWVTPIFYQGHVFNTSFTLVREKYEIVDAN